MKGMQHAVMITVGRFKRSKKPAAIAALLPLTFIVGYQWDFAYGNKMERVKGTEIVLETIKSSNLCGIRVSSH